MKAMRIAGLIGVQGSIFGLRGPSQAMHRVIDHIGDKRGGFYTGENRSVGQAFWVYAAGRYRAAR